MKGTREDQEIVGADLVEACFVERLVIDETAGLVDYYEREDGPVNVSCQHQSVFGRLDVKRINE